MAPVVHKLVIIAPLVAASATVWASDTQNPFGFNSAEIESIQYTRSKHGTLGLQAEDADARVERPATGLARQTEFSFKLKPKKSATTGLSGYSLGLFNDSRMEVNSRTLGFSDSTPTISELNEGLAYSAGLKFEQEDAEIDGTAYVSSSQLGLSYGRLGRLWYGGIDVNLEQFANGFYGSDQPDVLSLDVTTGRRLGFTGLSTHSPLWLLSVQGNFDMDNADNGRTGDGRGDWYLNPSLFWKQPGFTFSAQMQLPIEFETLNADGEPDYRLRAVFEKQFK
ncbi:MAG: hypothetical protein AB8B84_06425 [Granulosicoccus sp.]